MSIKRPVKTVANDRRFPAVVETIGDNNNTTRVTIPVTMLQYTSNNSWFAVREHSHGTILGINISASSASDGLTLSANLGGGAGGAALQGSGVYTQNSGTIQFVNSNDITFGLSTNQMTASFSQSTHDHPYLGSGESTYYQTSNLSSKFLTTAAQSSHTHGTDAIQQGLLVFNDSNGITFGNTISGLSTTITAAFNSSQFASTNHTHSDLYLNTSVSANFLTTAMQSASSSVFAKTGFTSSSISGTDIKGTLNTDGLSILVPNYLTIAAGAGDGVNIIAAGGSTAASTGTIVFSNSNGISFGLNGATVTAQHNALTTAAASDHTHSDLYINASISGNFQLTADNSLSLGTGYTTHTHSYLATAAASDHTHGSGVTASTAGSELLFTTASNSWQLGVPKWITTTPAQSVQPVAVEGTNGSYAFSTLKFITGNGMSFYTDASGIRGSYTVPTIPGATVFSNSNNINFGLNGSTVTASATGLALAGHTHSDLYLPVGNSTQWATSVLDDSLMALSYSSAFQTDTLASTFAQTANVMLTGERANYFYTSNNTFANSTHVHGANVSTASTAGVDIKFTSASGGLTVGVPAWITTYAGDNLSWELEGNNTAGTTGNQSAILYLSGGNNITLSGNSNTIIVSAANAAAGAISISAGTLSETRNSIVFSNSNNMSFGMSGSTITGSIPVGTVNFSDAGGITWSSSVGAGASSVSTSIYVGSMAAGGGVAIAGSAASTVTNGTMQFANANNISFGLNGSTMTASYSHSLLTGVAGSAASTVGAGVVQFANANGISFGLDGSTMTASQPAWVTKPMSYFEPFAVYSGSSSQNRALSTLYLQPFAPQYAITFNMINQIASATVIGTSCSNRIDFRIAGNSSHAFSAGVSATMANMEDIFLFSKGTGAFSSNIFSIGSTRNNFSTLYSLTYSHSAVGPAAGSIASASLRHSFSWAVIYPALTSAQSTSVDANSSATVWGTGGYGTYSPASVGTSISTTYNTTNTTGNYNVASTFAGNTRISSYKLIPFSFASSLTPGEYWIGMRRSSSSATAAGTGNSNVGANNSYTYTINTTQLTGSYQLTHYGRTYTMLSSLGWMGDISRNNMWINDGAGSFTATYDPDATYVNNMGQAAGAIALSDIRSLNFSSWMEFRCCRIGSTA